MVPVISFLAGQAAIPTQPDPPLELSKIILQIYMHIKGTAYPFRKPHSAQFKPLLLSF